MVVRNFREDCDKFWEISELSTLMGKVSNLASNTARR